MLYTPMSLKSIFWNKYLPSPLPLPLAYCSSDLIYKVQVQTRKTVYEIVCKVMPVPISFDEVQRFIGIYQCNAFQIMHNEAWIGTGMLHPPLLSSLSLVYFTLLPLSPRSEGYSIRYLFASLHGEPFMPTKLHSAV